MPETTAPTDGQNVTFIDRQTNDTSRKLYEDVAPGVVRIQTPMGVGSGFMVDKSGYIATAFHVVMGSPWITIETANGETLRATVKKRDLEKDIAILKTERAPTNAHPLPWGNNLTLVENGQVHAMGFAWGSREPRLTAGDIKFNSLTLNEKPTVLTSEMTVPGMSGGPLLDSNRRFAGLVSGGAESDQYGNMSHFASSEAIAKMLAETDPKFRLSYSPTGWAGDHANAISNYPILALADTAAIGGAGYGMYRATMLKPTLAGLGAGAIGAGLLAKDVPEIFLARTDEEARKAYLSTATDGGLLAGGLALRLNKKIGFGVIAVSALARLGAEFYPTEANLTVKE